MKKTYKFLVLILSLFFGFMFKVNAVSYCNDQTISTFNSSSSNTPASDQDISCGYDNGASERGHGYEFVEIYRSYDSNYGESYYVYNVVSSGGGQPNEYKMILCTAKFNSGDIVTYTEYDENSQSMLPYHSMGADTMEGDFYPNYSNGDYNDNLYYLLTEHNTDAHPNGMCPMYAGIKTVTYEDYQTEEFVYMYESYAVDTNGDETMTQFGDTVGGGTWINEMDRLSTTDELHDGYEYTRSDDGSVGYSAVTDVTVVPAKVKSGKITENQTIQEHYESNPCKTVGVLKTLKITHTIVDILKVISPIIIIIMASIKFGKAAINGDNDATKDASKYLVKKLILAVAIFLVPTMINLIVDIVYESPSVDDKSVKFGYCTVCLTGDKSTCDLYIETIENNQDADNIDEIIDDVVNPDYSDPNCSLASYNGLETYCRENSGGGNTAYGECIKANREYYERKCNCKNENYSGLSIYVFSKCQSQPENVRPQCAKDVTGQAASEARRLCEQGLSREEVARALDD